MKKTYMNIVILLMKENRKNSSIEILNAIMKK